MPVPASRRFSSDSPFMRKPRTLPTRAPARRWDHTAARAARGPEALGRDLQLPAPRPHERGVDAVGVGDVAHAHRATERVTVGAGRHPSDENAVAPDGLVAEEEWLGVVEGEHQEAPGRGLSRWRRSASRPVKVGLLEGDGEGQARLEWGVVAADVVAPGAVALLHPERVHRVVAGVAETEIRAGVDNFLVDGGRELRGDVELPAQLADVGDPRGPHER